ncbi:hypothetical protein AFLA_007882 [Aspergillus flavus NRRL3357]|nr:hypothetical protein AFLA_007882 [Aspergillus flavus NRRL3357]
MILVDYFSGIWSLESGVENRDKLQVQTRIYSVIRVYTTLSDGREPWTRESGTQPDNHMLLITASGTGNYNPEERACVSGTGTCRLINAAGVECDRPDSLSPNVTVQGGQCVLLSSSLPYILHNELLVGWSGQTMHNSIPIKLRICNTMRLSTRSEADFSHT